MKRMIFFLTFLLFSLFAAAQTPIQLTPEDVIHPYEEIRPSEKQSLFEMMESDNHVESREEQQEDPEMRKFEDRKISQ